MERCPNCRARTDGSASCRRCGMDLSLLQTTERAALVLRQQALEALVRGDHPVAQAALRQSLALRADEATKRLAHFANWLASRPPEPRLKTAESADFHSITDKPPARTKRPTWLQRLFGRGSRSPTS